jgi:hypothetical protein
VRYILIDERSDVGVVREVLRGRVFYVAILNYKWVEECLRRLARVELAAYNLERNYKATESSRAEVRRKLEEEPSNSRKRAINEFILNTTNKIRINNSNQTVRVQTSINTSCTPEMVDNDGEDSGSDTVVMDDPQQNQ